MKRKLGKVIAMLLAVVLAVSGIEPLAAKAAAKSSDERINLAEMKKRDAEEIKRSPKLDIKVQDNEEAKNSKSAAKEIGFVEMEDAVKSSARASQVASGWCGDNVSWSLTSDGVLTLNGSGSTWDYPSDYPSFYDYKDSIDEVIVGDGITRLGTWIFAFMNNLVNASISGDVEEIAEYAFWGCTGFTGTWRLNSYISYIGPAAFGANINVQGFEVSADNPYYASSEGHLVSKDKTTLLQYGYLTDSYVDLPYSVEEIGNYAMVYGEYSSFINSNITGLYAYAVEFCPYLQTVELDYVEFIGGAAFSDCDSIVTIVLPDTLEELYDHAFADCSYLSEITFKGDAPSFEGNEIFLNVYATAKYYSTNSGWTSSVRKDYGGDITWKNLAEKKSNTITAKNITKVVKSSAREIDLDASAKGGARLSYKSNNKNITVDSDGYVTVKKNYIGKATITITAAETSTYKKTTKKITVKINPVKATISSLKYKSKKITLKVKKNIGSVKYQIEYATNSKFNNSTKTTKSYNSNGYVISNPKKGKTYYFRVRGRKTVNDVDYWGNWSTVKKVKVPK